MKRTYPIIKKTFDWTDRPHQPLEGKNIPVGGACAYMGIQLEYTVDFGANGQFRIGTYQAFNAMGLIGSEQNGVVILQDDKRRVVLDRHYEINTGYFGASKQQLNEATRISQLNWEDFQDFVNNHPRHRYKV